jgi:hypothetical protein
MARQASRRTAASRPPQSVFNAPADQAALAPYREAGIQRVLLEVPDLSHHEILRVLDKNASLAKA